MEKAGLIIKREKDGTYFDRFRDRIMFPIFNRNGNTIAFSGRTLGADEPKYLNSPETAIFNKSKILYNYNLAKPSIKKSQQAVLFEGFADVISADRAGIENGIATILGCSGQNWIKGFFFQYSETLCKYGLYGFPLIKTKVID